MYTYPKSFASATAADALAFLKSPELLARRFAEIIAARGFVAHRILAARYKLQGGALVYIPDEATEATDAPERVEPGGEYPLIELSEDSAVVIEALKKGFGHRITDEKVGREAMDPIERALAMLANKLVSEFDEVALTSIASTVSQNVTGAAWTNTPKNIVKNVNAAKAKIRGLRLGFEADAIVVTEDQWAGASAELLDLLPREQRNGVESGNFVEALGLTWIHTPDLPNGWLPTVVDTRNLGGIGHEDIPSPEYTAVTMEDGLPVEIARFREQSDSTKVQVRKTDVPVIRNPKAACEITSTGL